jgi:hypothetical protein
MAIPVMLQLEEHRMISQSHISTSRLNALLYKTTQLQRLIADARRAAKPNHLRLLRLQGLKLAVQKRLADNVLWHLTEKPVLVPVTANKTWPRPPLRIVR